MRQTGQHQKYWRLGFPTVLSTLIAIAFASAAAMVQGPATDKSNLPGKERPIDEQNPRTVEDVLKSLEQEVEGLHRKYTLHFEALGPFDKNPERERQARASDEQELKELDDRFKALGQKVEGLYREYTQQLEALDPTNEKLEGERIAVDSALPAKVMRAFWVWQTEYWAQCHRPQAMSPQGVAKARDRNRSP